MSFLPADLTQPSAAETLVRDIECQWGAFDLLTNNASGDTLREFHTPIIDENPGTLQLDLVAPLALSHTVLSPIRSLFCDGMLPAPVTGQDPAAA